MKKLFFLLIAASGALSATAQTKNKQYHKDSLMSRWVFDINVMGGYFRQDLTSVTSAGNYPDAINLNTGNLKFANGGAAGFNGQIGFFVGKRRHFGLGTGIMYMGQWGTANLDNFHVEYRATDFQGRTFRQVVSGNQLRENIKISNFNIPIMLKYKNRFSEKWGFTADAGILVNLMMKNTYTTHASFDYEAIYKLVPNADGTTTAVYDNAATPASEDWLITKVHYQKNNPGGNVNDYFNGMRNQGYNVGLDVTPSGKTGTVSYMRGSIGFMVAPSMSYYISDKAAINLGVYGMYQPFDNTANTNYRLTGTAGDYSSVLNSVTAGDNISAGLNVGMRFFLGREHKPTKFTSVDVMNPSACGLCDGSVVIHGLRPNQSAAVAYSLNNNPQTPYIGATDATGTMKINGLCAGTYTDLTAKVRRKSSTGDVVTLTNPRFEVSSENIVSPSAQGACDGSITLNGLTAGQNVTVKYMMNGTAQADYATVVKPNRTVQLTNLCAGTYSGITVVSNGCMANGSDATLNAPAPPPPPPPAAEEKVDVSTPILFNVNKTTIKEVSMPVLEQAAKEMKEDESAIIVVDGYTDATGTHAYNQQLSVKRATSVKTELKKMGVNPKRVKTVGHGETKPAETNETPEGRMQNRRAVMKLNK